MSDPERSCGSCGLCCKVLDIDELSKPANRWCSHFAKGGGCTIYGSRPGVCREFQCLWLTSPGLGEEWKPNVAKFVLLERLDGQSLSVTVDDGFPQAWRRAPYYEQILAWAKERWKTNRHVVVVAGKSNIVLFPNEELEFIAPDNSEFRVGYRETGGVRRPWVQIRTAGGALTDILGKPEIGAPSLFGGGVPPILRGPR